MLSYPKLKNQLLNQIELIKKGGMKKYEKI